MTEEQLTTKWWAIQKAENTVDRCFHIGQLGWFTFLGLARNRLLDSHMDSRSGKAHFLIRIEFAVGPDLDVLVLRDFHNWLTLVWGIEVPIEYDFRNGAPIQEAMDRMYEDDEHPEGAKWSDSDKKVHVETMYQGEERVLMIAS